MNPKIKIFYNKFLDPIFLGYIASDPKWKDWKKPTIETVKEKVRLFNDLWDKQGRKIITDMQKNMGLSFKRNEIDVYIVSGNPRPFSRPIVLKSGYTPKEFVGTLTHELIHCLQSDNDETRDLPVWETSYPNETERTLKHISVMATLSYIFRDDHEIMTILKNQSREHSTNEYERAWKIVDSVGYKKIKKIARSSNSSLLERR